MDAHRAVEMRERLFMEQLTAGRRCSEHCPTANSAVSDGERAYVEWWWAQTGPCRVERSIEECTRWSGYSLKVGVSMPA